jgi:hypothetical protein
LTDSVATETAAQMLAPLELIEKSEIRATPMAVAMGWVRRQRATIPKETSPRSGSIMTSRAVAAVTGACCSAKRATTENQNR